MPAFAIAQHSRVTALTRRDTAKARASAAQYGIPYSFTSTEELARCEEVDQKSYGPLFQQGSEIMARYRAALGLRTAFHSDIAWLNPAKSAAVPRKKPAAKP